MGALKFEKYSVPAPAPVMAVQITADDIANAPVRPTSKLGLMHGLDGGTLFRAESTGKTYAVTYPHTRSGSEIFEGQWLIQKSYGSGTWVSIISDDMFQSKGYARMKRDADIGMGR